MFRNFLAKLFVSIIRLYRICVSPFLFPPCCRFYPSCSEYTITAILVHGPAKGSFMGIKRILRCNPLHPGGYDPVN